MRRRYLSAGVAVPGSTTIVGAPAVITTTSGTITVPALVTAGMTAIVVYSSADGLAIGGAIGPLTTIDERASGNQRTGIATGSGVVAGQLLAFAGAITKQVHVSHIYTDVFRLIGAGVAAAIRPGSQATSDTGSVVPAAGQRVAVIGTERTTVDGTTIVGVTSSGGETVTQLSYDEDAASTDTSIYFGVFTAAAQAARTATITYSGASANGYAAAIPAVALGQRGVYVAR